MNKLAKSFIREIDIGSMSRGVSRESGGTTGEMKRKRDGTELLWLSTRGLTGRMGRDWISEWMKGARV